jgi:glucose/arabinose dehydrogenase
MRLLTRPSLLLAWALLGSALVSAQSLTTKRIASGFSKPVWVGAPAGDDRLFVAEQAGLVRVVKNGVVLATPFLSLVGEVTTGNEQGLLGIAFHPNYASNGFFYVNYTDTDGDTHVARFTRSSTNPDVADEESEQLILFQAQPFSNHNAGVLLFGPADGYLYIPLGDGGSGNDPNCNAQSLATWLGKILRIDVDSAFPYAIPPDNPFVGVAGALPEIWQVGMRNPWRAGFDAVTGDLYVGDVGEGAREEIDFVPAGVGGLNFGWRVMEGTLCNGLGSCPATVLPCSAPGYTAPIFELVQSGVGGPRAIVGGYVYRGCEIPSLVGTYFCADYIDDKIRTFEYDPQNGLTNFQDRTAELAPGGGLTLESISTFGEDGFGELLIVDHSSSGSGEVYKVVPAGATAASAPVRNGSNTNRLCYANLSKPILGNLWRASIDATGHPGATFIGILGHAAPSSGTFYGSSEILIDLASPRLFRAILASSGGLTSFSSPVPCSASLNGAVAFTQAFVLGGGVELCNALDLTLGYY